MKNVLLIHGFNGIPKIFNYFDEELSKIGYNVILPEFPVREEITIDGYFKILDDYKNVFGDNLIVIAHSIGNPMLLKYIYKNSLTLGMYISLAGFSESFYNEGKDILNDKVKLTILSEEEKEYSKKSIKIKYSIYSNDDHIVPYDLLKKYCSDINSIPVFIENIGHMGKKSGIDKMPQIIDIIKKNYC